MYHNLKENFNGKNRRLPKCVPRPSTSWSALLISTHVSFADRTATLSDMARIVSTASRLLRFSNLDEKIETENQAVLTLARKRQLVN